MRMENLFIQILQRSQAPPLASSRNSKQAKELESFIIEKREGFMYALIGDSCHKGSGSRYFLKYLLKHKMLQAIQWGNDKLFNS